MGRGPRVRARSSLRRYRPSPRSRPSPGNLEEPHRPGSKGGWEIHRVVQRSRRAIGPLSFIRLRSVQTLVLPFPHPPQFCRMPRSGRLVRSDRRAAAVASRRCAGRRRCACRSEPRKHASGSALSCRPFPRLRPGTGKVAGASSSSIQRITGVPSRGANLTGYQSFMMARSRFKTPTPQTLQDCRIYL
jgi:hypothetical protein